MLSSNKKLRIAGAFGTLLMFAMGVGCNGFFVNPTLTGITVGPTTSIQTGSTVQMSAVGTYNDGTTQTISSGVYWSSSDSSIASVNKSGLVTGVLPGQATISGSSGAVTPGSATITVTLGGLTSIQVKSADGLSSKAWGDTEQFVATGTANGKQVIITDSVSWSIAPTNPNISIDTTGLLTASGGTGLAQFEVIATDPTTQISGFMNFSVQ